MPMTTAEHGIDLADLMREHQAGVWRFLRALGAEPNLADDITQETFLAVYRKPFEQRSRGQTIAYLRIVAKNLFLKARRRDGRELAVAELEQVEAEWNELVGEEDGAALAAALKECLKQLEDKPKQALDLQYQQGKQRVEIAATLGMTDDGVKTLLRRTKARLRKCMEIRVGGDT
ncbi:MAG: sigma-70 family RNA polymerase sigma factor [Planctomycetes bacterium]|nr:sigma-70 family RNA polymerase sigma factor [Planctomycetota bacterium]